MIEEPCRYLEAFAKAGANILSIHVEAQPNLSQALTSIKKLGLLAGAALNPSTPVTALETVASEVDVVLVMSVNPGFGGQRFIPSSIEKVRDMRALLESVGNPAPIAVDGGVDLSNAGELVAAGANILVAGSAIFGQDDPTKATRALRAATEGPAIRESN
jgi:ribulose-phosphate 3-epimerase